MRLIDADELKKKISYRQWDVGDDLPRDEASTRISERYVIDRMVDEMLTVDAVPVIRCRDCKWYYRGGATCMYWDGANSGDDFCSRAERKEE